MQMTIPHIDDLVVLRLKQLAWQEGATLEDLVRRILTDAAFAKGGGGRNLSAGQPPRIKRPA